MTKTGHFADFITSSDNDPKIFLNSSPLPVDPITIIVSGSSDNDCNSLNGNPVINLGSTNGSLRTVSYTHLEILLK